jgi:hypothetical protein
VAVASAVALLLVAFAFMVFLAYQRNWHTSGGGIMPSQSAIGVLAVALEGVSRC